MNNLACFAKHKESLLPPTELATGSGLDRLISFIDFMPKQLSPV
jgi:hypothetical protein